MSNQDSWINFPYAASAFDQHEQLGTDLDIKKHEGDGGVWNVSSHAELALKVTLLIVDGLVTNPLIALASLVEGVLRAASGGVFLLLSLIPFEGNETVSKLGEKLLSSAGQNGSTFGYSLFVTLIQPATAIWSAIRYSWDTSCCTAQEG